MTDIIKHQAENGAFLPAGIDEKTFELAKVVGKVNLCFSQFHLPDELIESWAQVLLKHSPELDLGKVQFLIDQFHLGLIEFDKNQGIQNFTVNLAKIKKYGKGYRLSHGSVNY